MWSVLLVAASAAATSVSVGSLTVDGLEVRDLQCELTSGGMFASFAVAGELAKHKPAFDACAPAGGAFESTWAWSAGATSDVTVKRSSKPDAHACISKVLQSMGAPAAGTCTAFVLVGDSAGATAAYTEAVK